MLINHHVCVTLKTSYNQFYKNMIVFNANHDKLLIKRRKKECTSWEESGRLYQTWIIFVISNFMQFLYIFVSNCLKFYDYFIVWFSRLQDLWIFLLTSFFFSFFYWVWFFLFYNINIIEIHLQRLLRLSFLTKFSVFF